MPGPAPGQIWLCPNRPRRRSRPRPVEFAIKQNILAAGQVSLRSLVGKEIEDENDDEDEDDWGSRRRELRPTIVDIVCLKAIDQSGQHCCNPPEHFLNTVCKLVIFTGWFWVGGPLVFENH